MDAVEQMKTQHSKDADICHSLNMAQQVVIARCVDLVNSLIFKQEKLDKLSQRADGEAAKRVSAERDLASLRASVDGGGGDAGDSGG